MAAEMDAHLEEQARRNLAAGMSADDARAAAHRQFGGVAQIQERAREVRGLGWPQQMGADLRHAFRLLRTHPGFATTALLTLVIGIGANTAMFSIVSSVVLRPLPFDEPDRLVVVWTESPRLGIVQAPAGYANVVDWRERSRSFSDFAVSDGFTATVSIDGEQPVRTRAVFASPNFFPLLGVQPQQGRMPTSLEAEQREPLAVVSHRFWQDRLQGDPNVLGRHLDVDGRVARVVGVMPEYVASIYDDEIWLPHTLVPDWAESRLSRGTGSWRVLGRLAPGVSLAAAQAELSGIAATLARAYPVANADLSVRLVPLAEHVVGPQVRLALFALAGAVAAVLLIACGNLANLLLARGTARQREFAVRLSLGATRGRLIRQLLVENFVLAFLAAVLGSGLALLVLRGVRVFGPENIPHLHEAHLDGGALAFAILLALVSALLFGLMPALRATARDPLSMLREGGRSMSEGRPARRMRAALVVAEFALAIVLVAGAGLLLRSFARLVAVDPGFQVDGVLVAGSWFPKDRPREDVIPYVRRLVDEIEALPGVTAAAVSEEVLLSHRWDQAVTIEGTTPDQSDVVRLPLSVESITPGWFRVMGVELKRGRLFTEHDDAGSLPVVIINETLARHLWPGEDPIGRRLRTGDVGDDVWLTVAGVVADLRRQGLDRAPVAQAFLPLAQNPPRPLSLVIRTNIDPAALAGAVRAAIRSVDPTVPEFSISTLRREVDRTLAPRQFHTGLLTVFAGIALLLSGIGIFGLLHYSVARRTHEIGVRMALGAQRGMVLKQIMREGLTLALIGIVLGGAAAAVLLRSLSSLLFDVGPLDPVSFLGAVGLLLLVAVLACYLPARRAASVDPIVALREE